MKAEESIAVAAPPATVWRLVTHVEGAADLLEAVTRVEVLARPASGLVGLEWRETRTLFGREATETLRVAEVREGEYYAALAESSGMRYLSEVFVRPGPDADHTHLTMRFAGRPTNLFARLVSPLVGPLMAGPMRRALRADLEDVKRAAERAADGSG